MFGSVSLFTGTQIYNGMLYVSFNLFFTSLPIIWFSTMDYEYPKHIIVKRPRLYRIGLQDLYFNKWVFWRWIFYAFWQSSLILFLAYYTLDHLSPDENGMFGGIFMGGEFIFGTLVIVSNMKIMISSYLVSGWMLFFVIGSTLFYVLCFVIISFGLTSSPEFGTLTMMLEAP